MMLLRRNLRALVGLKIVLSVSLLKFLMVNPIRQTFRFGNYAREWRVAEDKYTIVRSNAHDRM